MSLLNVIKKAERTAVDYKFIHAVAAPVVGSNNMRYVLHENLPAKPSLNDLFKGKDCVCILFRVLDHGRPTPVAHWTCLMKGSKGIMFFDSLAMNLSGIYRLTHEPRKVEYALRNTRYEKSHRALQDILSKVKYCGCAVAVRLRHYKTHTNKQFESFILNHHHNAGETLATLCLFHYTDEQEYEEKSNG